MKQKSILVVSSCMVVLCMVVLCVVLLCGVPSFVSGVSGAEKDPVADVNVEEKDPNSIVRLSTLSNEECLEFLRSRDVYIPDFLLEPDRNFDFRRLIVQFEKAPWLPFIVNDPYFFDFAKEVRQAVIQYYGFDDSLRPSEAIIQAINNQDSKTIKSLLSEYFIAHCTDADLKIDEMIAFIDGEIISYDKPLFGAECGSFEGEDLSASICFMTDQGTEYYIGTKERYMYKDLPEKLGAYFIVVKNLSKLSEDPESKKAIFILDVTD